MEDWEPLSESLYSMLRFLGLALPSDPSANWVEIQEQDPQSGTQYLVV